MPSIGGLLCFKILDHTIKAMTIVKKNWEPLIHQYGKVGDFSTNQAC